MSEELKCPCCDGVFILVYNEGRVVGGFCRECSFSCGMECLYKITAAMELAKTIVESENCKAEDECKYQEFVEWARQYVLEVFK